MKLELKAMILPGLFEWILWVKQENGGSIGQTIVTFLFIPIFIDFRH